jgi:hypothetical protein
MARTRRDAKLGNRTTQLKLTRGKRHQSTLDWAWHCDIAGPVAAPLLVVIHRDVARSNLGHGFLLTEGSRRRIGGLRRTRRYGGLWPISAGEARLM